MDDERPWTRWFSEQKSAWGIMTTKWSRLGEAHRLRYDRVAKPMSTVRSGLADRRFTQEDLKSIEVRIPLGERQDSPVDELGVAAFVVPDVSCLPSSLRATTHIGPLAVDGAVSYVIQTTDLQTAGHSENGGERSVGTGFAAC